MPWEPLREPPRLKPAAFFRKAKLYADEDIEEEVVELLRARGVAIESARELGHRGKPDEFHAGLAFRERRLLLTKNAKHVLSDSKLPLTRTWGVVALDGDLGDQERYGRALLHVLRLIVPYGQICERSKIRVSAARISVRFVDAAGRLTTERFRIGPDGTLERWV